MDLYNEEATPATVVQEVLNVPSLLEVVIVNDCDSQLVLLVSPRDIPAKNRIRPASGSSRHPRLRPARPKLRPHRDRRSRVAGLEPATHRWNVPKFYSRRWF